jgi:hypothetical protein
MIALTIHIDTFLHLPFIRCKISCAKPANHIVRPAAPLKEQINAVVMAKNTLTYEFLAS